MSQLINAQLCEVRPDGGGALKLSALAPKGKHQLIVNHGLFRDDPVAAAWAVVGTDPVEVIARAPASRGGAYFDVTGELDETWTEPYRKNLETITGRKTLPDIPDDYLLERAEMISYYVTELRLTGGRLHYRMFEQGQEWKDKTHHERAILGAHRVMCLRLGALPTVQEFIPDASGSAYYRNPSYGQAHEPAPAFKSEWFWRAIIDWWLEHEATSGQKAAHYVNRKLMSGATSTPCLYRMQHGIIETGIRMSWDPDTVIKWKKFQKL